MMHLISLCNPVVIADMKEICNRISPEDFNGKTILVTGANSMLGTYMAYLYIYMARTLDVDVKTIVLTRTLDTTRKLYKEVLDNPRFDIIHSDVTVPISYPGKLDYIFHFAGNASPVYITNDPVGILKSNVIGTFNVMELAKEKNAKVIFASTREVYGKVDALLLDEKKFGALDPMDNRSCYPESKRAAESIMRAYYNQYDVDFVSARIAHCYGPGMKLNDGRVMSDFIGDAVNGHDITLNSSGEALRAFCYISDAIAALLLLALKGESGEAYNLSNELESKAIRDVAKMVSESTPNAEIKVTYSAPTHTGGYCAYKRVALDNTLINRLGFTPTVSLREGIERTLKSFKDNG